jgi:hypothetical protein
MVGWGKLDLTTNANYLSFRRMSILILEVNVCSNDLLFFGAQQLVL